MRAIAVMKETGLAFGPGFLGDGQFWLALIAAPGVLGVMTLLYPDWAGDARISVPVMLSAVLWQPVVEELLFRGVVQGKLGKQRWGRSRVAGISVANYIATLLFMLAHLVNQPLWWAAAVGVPSLVFGHFRDRYGQIYPSILLHAAYNAVFFLMR